MSKPQTIGALPASATIRILEDRRRPGRPKDVNPSLLPLIREDMLPRVPVSQLPTPWPEEEIGQDNLGPIRGMMFAMALSLPIWAAIGIGIEYLME